MTGRLALMVLLAVAPLGSVAAQLAGKGGAGVAADTITAAVQRRADTQWYDLGARGTYGYSHPGFLQSVRNWPGTLAAASRLAVQRDALPTWGIVAVTTAATFAADEWLLDRTRSLAKVVGLPPNHPSVNVRLGKIKLVPLPTTLGSGIYFLGDGMATLAVAGGFAAYGVGRNDNRARRTASQITEALLVAGTFTQLIKHATGRQTPSEATEPRGRWNWFPSLADYKKNVPGHDAMPSGHLAVAFATVEVIARNYPEKRIVRPIGYTLLTALSFSMMNNGVHWASDYPLALALGGGVAKVAVERGRVSQSGGSGGSGVRPLIGPGVVGLSVPFPR